MKKLVCTVLVLVFVTTVAISGGNQTIYATSSPALDAIVAGSAAPAELGNPRWFTWRKFFWGMAAAVVVWLSRPPSPDPSGEYIGVSEAVFD